MVFFFQDQQPRMLCLGARVELIESYPWESIPRGLNVSDYEVVIYYLPPLAERMRTWLMAKNHRARKGETPAAIGTPPGFPIPRLQAFRQMVSSSRRLAIFVGSPNTSVSADGTDRLARWAFPWFPPVLGERTRVVERSDDSKLARYLQEVETAEALGRRRTDGDPSSSDVLHEILTAAELDTIQDRRVTVLAGGTASAAAVLISATAFDSEFESVAELRALWLPVTTRIEPIEGLRVLIEDLCGLDGSAQEPEWSASVVLPSERPIIQQVDALVSDVAELHARIEEHEAARNVLRRFHPLLWLTGPPLEVLVREALKELGASANPSPVKGQEDGLVVDPQGHRWVLEVKGQIGGMKRKDVTDAHTHETEVVDRQPDFDGRALLVENCERLLPPGERQRMFPDNARSVAERWRVPILYTEQLLAAIALHQVGRLDRDRFWAKINEAAGLVDLPSELPDSD